MCKKCVKFKSLIVILTLVLMSVVIVFLSGFLALVLRVSASVYDAPVYVQEKSDKFTPPIPIPPRPYVYIPAPPMPEAEEEVYESVWVSLGIFELSAYCPCIRCCEIWSYQHPRNQWYGFVQRTASGTIPTQGRTIATDTNVIPFGTVVYIYGIGEFIAEDRGGAIRGNTIDKFFYCHNEALIFGRQRAEVFVKEGEDTYVTHLIPEPQKE
jgi:3D (Asp-Asp-Asp) domain-containing protein